MKSKQTGFAHVTLVLLLVVVAVVGFAGWRVYSSSRQKPVASVSEQEVEETLPEDLSSLLTIDKVTELALAEQPGSQVAVIELEQEGQSLVYKVVLSDGTVFRFNAASGNRLAAEYNKEEASDETLPNDFKVSISLVEAVDKAKQTLPGKKVRKVQLEVEDGVVVYSVRFTDGSRVDVNAATGEVVRIKDKLHEESDEDSDQGASVDGSDDDDDHDEEEDDDQDKEDDDGDQSENSGSSGSNSGSGGVN